MRHALRIIMQVVHGGRGRIRHQVQEREEADEFPKVDRAVTVRVGVEVKRAQGIGRHSVVGAQNAPAFSDAQLFACDKKFVEVDGVATICTSVCEFLQILVYVVLDV